MDCIDLFKRAAMALQTDPRYVILDQARKANDKDEELQNLIGEFNLARMDLNNEIGKNERDDARIAELNEKVNSLYGQIMGNEGMVAYNEAKRECENLVNYIDAIINTAMNGGDPMTVQEPKSPIRFCAPLPSPRRLPLSRVFIGTRLCNTDRVLFAPAVTARKPADGTIQGKEEKPWQSFRP